MKSKYFLWCVIFFLFALMILILLWEWKIAPLDLPRGRSVENMLAEFDAVGINRNIIKVFPTIANAWQQTLTEAQENDRIVAFGSFHTVAQIVELIN